MLKLKKVSTILMAILMLSLTTSVFAEKDVIELETISINDVDEEYIIDEGSFNDSNIIVPYGMEIEDGSHSGSYNYSVSVTNKNGEYLNFWIENTGNHDIDIQIDNGKTKTIRPGKNGHVNVELGYFTKTYKLKAYATKSGSISFNYRIAQRKNQ